MARIRLFDYPFDFQEYIEKRLREFDDVEERKFAKSVLQEGLLTIIEETEKKYKNLEKRVFKEIENKNSKYEIRMTVIRRENYDPVNQTWFPILMGDLCMYQVTDEELRKAIEEKRKSIIQTVYIKAADSICRQIDDEGTVLIGKILTDKGEIAAKFRLRQSAKHREKSAHLYELFMKNHIPWSTLNSAYLDKVYVVELEETESNISREENFSKIVVDYGAYTSYIEEDIIPLWNIEKICYNSNQFPVPCIDSINYEHEFPLKEYGAQHGFLFEKDNEITGIRFEEEKIIVVTPEAVFKRWDAYRIIRDEPIQSLGYVQPVLTNHQEAGFIRNYMNKTGIKLATKADLMRRVNALAIDKFIHYTGCEIIQANQPYPAQSSMNWFIQDELFDLNSRRILLLKFIPNNPENYLNDAILCYAVSEIQQDEAEYRCIGIFE